LPDGVRRVFHSARLLFISSISRFGGFSSAIACMTIETVGPGDTVAGAFHRIALIGAGLTGFGLSLVYPALGVEAIKQVPNSSRGSGLSAYAVFFDLALAIAGPLMGAIALNLGYSWIFFSAALLSVVGLGLTLHSSAGQFLEQSTIPWERACSRKTVSTYID
jgi:predicted MFS family arabinose efflux permease